MTPKEFAAAKHRWLDTVAADGRLGHLAFRLAYIMAGYFNGRSADAWPAQTTLANRLGVTTRAIQNCLDQLGAGGYLLTELGKGRGNTNRYQPAINHEPLFALSNHEGRTAVPENTNGCSEKGEPSFVQNLLYEPSLGTFSTGDIDSAFEEWFDNYPRKESKQATREIYREVITRGKATPEQLLAKATAYASEEAQPIEPRMWLMRGKYQSAH